MIAALSADKSTANRRFPRLACILCGGAPITDATTVTRGHGRSKTLQIRLNPQELEELERVAASRGLPTSTVAREAIMRLVRPAEARSADRRRIADQLVRYLDNFTNADI